MISEELITYKTAQLAKQAGFDIPCKSYFTYRNALFKLESKEFQDRFKWYRPTQSLLQRWLREVYNCHVEVTSRKDYDDKIVYTWDIYGNKISNEELTDEEPLFNTYELALEQALQEALTLIINRKETNNGI